MVKILHLKNVENPVSFCFYLTIMHSFMLVYHIKPQLKILKFTLLI